MFNTRVRNQKDGHYIAEIVEDLFNAKYLDRLHELTVEEYTKLFEIGKDSTTIFHKKFYDKYRAGWNEMVEAYEYLIRTTVSNDFEEDFLYQKFPTFRVHLPGNVAVGAFHTDAEFGHPAGERNYILPLTNSSGTASCWVESEPGKNDFSAMKMRVGELITFNGNILRHGNKPNETDRTRVSMDFRAILVFDLEKANQVTESITTGTKFQEGAYYKLFKK